MNSEELQAALKADAYGRSTEEERAYLEAHPFEARLVLRRMMTDITDQLANLDADREWQGRARRLRSRLGVRLEEYEERCAGLDSRYRSAIERHKAEIGTGSRSPEVVDAQLWAVLDEGS